MADTINDFTSRLDEIEVIDAYEDFKISLHPDILQMLVTPHVRTLLYAAGMPEENISILNNSSISLLERWGILEPYLEYIRHCYPANMILDAIRTIYDLELNKFTIDGLNQQHQSKHNINAINKLLEQFHIKAVTSYVTTAPGTPFSVCTALDMEPFANPDDPEAAELLQSISNIGPDNFDEWLAAVEIAVNNLGNAGGVLRLSRPLTKTQKVKWKDAEEMFNRVMDGTLNDRSEFASYMQCFAFDCAERLKMTVQLARGITLDTIEVHEFFNRFNHLRFDCIGANPELAGIFPHVYINSGNLCVSNPPRAKRILHRMLVGLPSNKISLCSGEFTFPENAIGFHIRLRRFVAEFLAECHENGMTEQQCMFLAKRWLNGTAKELYNSSL